MIQLHPKNYWKVLYGGGPQTISFLDTGTAPVFPTFGIAVPIPIIVRNLTMVVADPAHTSITLTVQKNAVSTGLSVTSGGGVVTPVKNTSIAVSFAPGEILRGHFSGAAYFFGDAPSVGVCIETEGAEHIYAQVANNLGNGVIGGALGNGHASSYGGSPVPSNSRSYCAIPGTITGLATRLSFVPGAGTWTAYVVKNGVIQNGSGGTVDTACACTGLTQYNYRTFSLPAAIQDIFDILTLRTGSSADGYVSNCVTFAPDTDGRFMFCGGSNAAVNSALDYRWNDSTQDAQPEAQKAGIIGPGGVVVHGMYIHKQAPGPSASYTTTNTLRRNGINTALAVTMIGLQNSGSDLTPDEPFPEDATIDILCTNTGGGNNNSLFWSIPVSLPEPPPPPPDGILIVEKVIAGTADGTQFPIDVVGLLPTQVTLGHGASHTYDPVTPGSGYAVSEVPPAGWEPPVIVVDNASPPTNISVASGETVTVTVTNTATVIPPEPPVENDCPEQVAAGCWSPHDINRLTVNLDGDYEL